MPVKEKMKKQTEKKPRKDKINQLYKLLKEIILLKAEKDDLTILEVRLAIFLLLEDEIAD